MPRTGRPPKPIEVKRLLGNPGKRALPRSGITAIQAVVKLPAPPKFENGRAWVQAILDQGASSWVGVTDQLGLLELLAGAYDEHTELVAMVAAGTAPRRDLRDLQKQITAWLSLLGLTPTDRSRLGVAEVKVASKLEELAAKRAGRRAI